MKKIPLTFWYWPLYLIYVNVCEERGWELTIPLPKEGEIVIGATMLFVIIGAVLLAFEIAKAIRFSPRDNNIDAFFSLGVAVAYLIMLLFFSYWQHQIFLIFTIFSLIDAVVGLLAILGISRRDFDVNR